MSILVVCPGCLKRFSVSEKFAGQTGPCPHCKGQIRVPTADEEVKVHTPEQHSSGGRGIDGQLILKPIEREDAKWNPVVAAMIGGAAIAVLAVAWLGGNAGLFAESMLISAVALVAVSPALTVAGYVFLRDNEDLFAYRGKELLIRAGICGLVYSILWWLYGYVAPQVLTGELWSWFLVVPPLLAAGAVGGLASLDLDFADGFLHYCFYLLVTIVLRAAAGLGWVWDLPDDITTLSMLF